VYFDNHTASLFTLSGIARDWFWHLPALTAVALEIAFAMRDKGWTGRAPVLADRHTRHSQAPWPAPILLWALCTSVGHILAFEIINGGYLYGQAYTWLSSLAWLVVILLGQTVAYLIRYGICRPKLPLLWVLPLVVEAFDSCFAMLAAGLIDIERTYSHMKMFCD